MLLAFSAGAMSCIKVFLCKMKNNVTVQIVLSNDAELL
jgi:hypothetical protein